MAATVFETFNAGAGQSPRIQTTEIYPERVVIGGGREGAEELQRGSVVPAGVPGKREGRCSASVPDEAAIAHGGRGTRQHPAK